MAQARSRPQMERLKFPLTARQVEALDSMLEELFRAQRRPAGTTSASETTLLGRGTGSGDGPIEEITLGANLDIVGTELQVDFSSIVVPDELTDLTDILLTALATGDLLQWDGTDWINITVANLMFDAPRWELLSTGDPTFPEIVFAGGEPVYVFNLTP